MSTSSKTKPATEDFVKNEIEKLRIRMDSKFADVNEKLQDHDLKFVTIDNKLDRVLTQLDSLAGQFKTFGDEQTMQSGRIAIHSDEIKELQNVVFA